MTSATTDRRIGLSGGQAFKVPCKAASTTNLVLSGEQTVDGVACVTGDRVLVKSQSDQTTNGIYVVSTASWTRDLDFDGNLDAVTGTLVMTLNGSTNSNSFWRLATSGVINFGSSLISFARSFVNDSSLISFIQSGTGAVATDVQSKLRQTVSAADFLSTAQLTQAASGTLAASDAFTAVQAAVSAVHLNGGGVVNVPQGVYMGALSKNLNLYAGVSPTAPVMVIDMSRSDHINYYTGTNDVEYNFMGGTSLAGGPNTPIARIHNFGKDGARNPSLFFSYGTTPEQGSTTELGWTIGGSNDGSAHSNVPAHDLVIAGGQGASYTVGTAYVDATLPNVSGNGTAWTSDLVGGIFTLDSQPNAAGIIKSVTNATNLILQSTWGTYGGTTDTNKPYEIQGGQWNGALTSDYRGRLVLGQNYTWLFNTGNYSSGADYDPRAVANGAGAYAANISFVFNGNRLKGGALNPSTLLKLDNATGSMGQVGHVYAAGAYAGAPSYAIYLDKVSNKLYIGKALDGSGGLYIASDGSINIQTGTEGTFTPLIQGSTTAGASSGGAQAGWWSKIGRWIYFTINASWTGHTGTGNLIINLNDIPYTSSASKGTNVFNVLSYNLTFTNQLSAYMATNTKTVQLLQQSSGAAYGAIPMDIAVADLVISGSFRID